MQERDPAVVRVLLQDQASARVREPVLVQELVEVQMDPAVVRVQVSGWGLEPGSVRLAVRAQDWVQEPGLVLVPGQGQGQGWWSRR